MMKKAFSLLELVLSLIIFGIIVSILVFPSTQIYKKALDIQNKNNIFLDLNYILLNLEKIYQSCYQFKYDEYSFECYMNASNDIFYDTNLKEFNFSGVMLNIGSFISPNSNFYFIKNGVSYGILSNYKDIHSNKKQKNYSKDYIYLYALGSKKIYKAYVNDRENVVFSNGNFEGFYGVVYAYIKINFEKNKIFLDIKDFENNKNRFLLYENIDNFRITKEKNIIKITLCKQKECLNKWIFK
ncbi:type II secretion system protein [Campylobacter insulaenigrae]|uniref:Type II secretion system protein n=1 Tax=Campylobacter insulaenigrae TaxID=260714 RepID=A0ABY3G3C7_9BACT|nr:type II secretion system protein [Campylobacter insulaenigrae]TWO24547.1 type II secretion system protein [Campylobacter insulaenigrae]